MCVGVGVCEHCVGIKDVMQDYPAGRFTTSSSAEMEIQRGGGEVCNIMHILLKKKNEGHCRIIDKIVTVHKTNLHNII